MVQDAPEVICGLPLQQKASARASLCSQPAPGRDFIFFSIKTPPRVVRASVDLRWRCGAIGSDVLFLCFSNPIGAFVPFANEANRQSSHVCCVHVRPSAMKCARVFWRVNVQSYVEGQNVCRTSAVLRVCSSAVGETCCARSCEPSPLIMMVRHPASLLLFLLRPVLRERSRECCGLRVS